ncbi:MAG: glycosyltransferase family 39 protein [Planctomycetes bacterium]|nr:glycosyltransferase family 39 protein [Planctomycetota bacterium]
MTATTGGTAIEPAPVQRGRWIALLCVLFLALVVRSAVVFAPPSDLFEKEQVNQEELLRGIAAEELLEGPVAPLLDYQVNHFWGGSLVVSFVAVPFYYVFGSRLVALRLVGVVFALLAVYCAFRLLDRFVSRKAAWIGALLLALSPPGYTYLTCMVFGTHMESNALALALTWAYFEWRARGRSSVLGTVLLGVLSGFALWFGYGLLLVILLTALFEFIDDRWFWLRRRSVYWIAGFAVGFAPWILYGLQQGFRGLEVYDAGIFEHFVQGVTRGTAVDMRGVVRYSLFEKAWMVINVDLPEALWFHHSLGINALDVGRGVLLGLLAIVIGVAWTTRRGVARTVARAFGRGASAGSTPLLAVFTLTFLVLYFAAYVASDFAIGPRGFVLNFRYLMPFWPFVALAGGIGVAAMIESRGFMRVAGIAGVLALCVLSSWSTIDRCRFETMEANWERPGMSETWFARLVVLHFGTDAEKMTRVVENIEQQRTPEVQARLFRMIGLGLRTFGRGDGENKKEKARNVLYRRTLSELERRAPPEYRALFAPAATN